MSSSGALGMRQGTGRHHTYKKGLHPVEGSSELSKHVGQAIRKVNTAVLRLASVVSAGPYSSQKDQAT